MQDRPTEALSIPQAAELAGIGRTKLYHAMGSGELPSLKVGNRRLIRREALAGWLARLERDATAFGIGLKDYS